MNKLRTAVLGVGYLGFFHAQKHKSSPYADFQGVFDAQPERAKKVAQDLGVRAFSSLQELKGQVEAVTIAAITQAHFELAEFCLNNGIHVNIEKPITAQLQQSEKLLKLSQKNNLKISVGHIERFNPCFDELRKLDIKLEHLILRRVGPFKTRAADVSVLHDLMIHDVDLLTWWTQSKIKKFSVQKEKVFTKTWDWADVHIEMENGVTAQLTASRVTPTADRSIQFLSQERSVWAHLGTLEIQEHRLKDLLSPEPVSQKSWTAEKRDALQFETDEFLKSVIHDTQTPVPAEAGIEALAWIEEWSK
jgi:predicted dehydrogenase